MTKFKDILAVELRERKFKEFDATYFEVKAACRVLAVSPHGPEMLESRIYEAKRKLHSEVFWDAQKAFDALMVTIGQVTRYGLDAEEFASHILPALNDLNDTLSYDR